MMWFLVLFSLWSVTSCIDKIPEVAKTKVSKPKRYSLSKLRLVHAPLKQLIQTRPHMSTSRCGNICIRHGFSNRSSVDAAVSGRSGVFLVESKSSLFGLQKVDAFRNHYDYLQQNSTTQMLSQCILWMTVSWSRRGGDSDFALTIWCF